MQNTLAAATLALAALVGSVIVGPWQPLPGDTLLVQDYSDAVPGTFPNYLASKCMVNKAYEDWQTKALTCDTATDAAMCEAHGYCYWRDTTSQNYQGWAEYVGYAPSITEMVPGAYDISSQTGGVARVQVVVTANGIVLYDCMDNPTQGALAKEALRARIGSKVDNVLAIFYSHSHVDHFLGCPGWVAPAQIYSAANPAGIHIYASMQFIPALQAEQQVAATVIKRTAEQLGNLLQDGPDGSLYSMIEYVPTQPLFYVPTDWLTPLAATTLIIDGVAFMALPLPCETDSNIALYVPSLRVAFVSSIYYRQQPFIGTVRGGTPRPIKKWIEQISAIKSMYPLAIGVSHSFPMIGLQKIQYELQWTIDRMTYMMNYIISRLNNGMHPRDVAWNLENENAFLHGQSGVSPQELYGYPYAAAMGTFVNTLGWYTGSIEELEMVNKTTEAVRIVELMGGMTSVVSKVKNALKNADDIDDLRFALQLAAYALRACPTSDSVNRDSIKLYYADACTRLGHLQINIPKRNTYLSAAIEVNAM